MARAVETFKPDTSFEKTISNGNRLDLLVKGLSYRLDTLPDPNLQVMKRRSLASSNDY